MAIHSKWVSYSFLTKSAKLKPVDDFKFIKLGYSFLTKSAKLKQVTGVPSFKISYSFLTKSAKLKHIRRNEQGFLGL